MMKGRILICPSSYTLGIFGTGQDQWLDLRIEYLHRSIYVLSDLWMASLFPIDDRDILNL